MTPITEIMLLTGVGSTATLGAIAAATSTPEASIAPYVGGGAGVIAVGALAEVVRRLLNGALIPRQTKDYEDELAAAIAAAGQREANSMQHGEMMRRTVEDVKGELRDAKGELKDMREEMELLRRAIDRRREE